MRDSLHRFIRSLPGQSADEMDLITMYVDDVPTKGLDYALAGILVVLEPDPEKSALAFAELCMSSKED